MLALYFTYFANPARAAATIDMLRASARAAESSVIAQLTLLQAEVSYLWVRGENRACLELIRKALSIAARTGAFAWDNMLHGIGASAASDWKTLPWPRVSGATGRDGTATRRLAGGMVLLPRGMVCGAPGRRGARASLRGAGAPERRSRRHADVSRGDGVCRSERASIGGALGQANTALQQAQRTGRDLACSFVIHVCDLIESDFLWDEDRERALASLRKGFALARAHGYHTVCWMDRAMTTRLAVRALENGIEPDHVRTGILKHRLAPPGMSAQLDSWPWQYRLRALGSFELAGANEASARSNTPERRDGARDGPRGVPLRLLETLVALGARNVRDVDLIDALWPNAEGDAGRRVFDTTLHRLRRKLGSDDALRLSDGRLGLDDRLWWVDLWALEDVFAEVDREIRRGAPPPVLVSLSRRLHELYRGPLLAHRDDPWTLRPREKLAARFRRAVDELAAVVEQRHMPPLTALYSGDEA